MKVLILRTHLNLQWLSPIWLMVIGDQLLMLLHALLLWADHQEIEQDDQANQGRKLQQHVLNPTGTGTTGSADRLSKCGGGKHSLSRVPG